MGMTHHEAISDAPIPELPLIGYLRANGAFDAGLIPHRHECWELSWLQSGSVDWWASDELCEVSSGDRYLTRPGEIHGAVSGLLEPCKLYWLHIDPRKLGGLDPQDARHLRAALAQAPSRLRRPGIRLA